MAGKSDTVPTEFQYWQRVDDKRVRLLRRVIRRTLGFDPAPSDDIINTFGAMYFDADPLAEAFVDDVYLTRGAQVGRQMLDRALAHGVDAVPDAPDSLRALFADLEADPDWVNHRLVETGARTFRRYGVDVFRFAGALTLHSYAENSVAKPLILSGAYAGDRTRHRFLETASFWIDVSEPGGLERGAPGRDATMRVRIMHVFVRRRLLAHPEWDLDAWGVPISQADAVLTLMGGSVAPGIAMHAMGYRTSVAEIEAMMHFWRYVGHLMGVRPRWYPQSVRQALQLGFVAAVKSTKQSGEDGRILCQSFANAFAPRDGDRSTRAALSHRKHLGFTRFFMTSASYRHNQLPPAGLWSLGPLAAFPLIFTAETARRTLPMLDTVADLIARRGRKRWLDRNLRSEEVGFHAPESFSR